ARDALDGLLPLPRIDLVGAGGVGVPGDPELTRSVGDGGHPTVAFVFADGLFPAPRFAVPELQQDDRVAVAKSLPDEGHVPLAVGGHARPDVAAGAAGEALGPRPGALSERGAVEMEDAVVIARPDDVDYVARGGNGRRVEVAALADGVNARAV